MAPTTKSSVGFVGVGAQGGPIAERILAAGFRLSVWARRREAAAALEALGATVAAHVDDLGGCDVVGVCVVDDAGVKQVFDALLPALKPGAVMMILATVHPDTCVRLAERAAARSVEVIDTPVSGGAEVARAGRLTVMAGGSAEALERCRPVIESFSARLVHLGGVGAGQLAKLLNNTLLTAHLALAHEVLQAGVAMGLDRTALADLLAASSGRSYGLELMGGLPSPGAFASGAALLRKDTDLFAVCAQAHGVQAGQTLAAAECFLQAAASNTCS